MKKLVLLLIVIFAGFGVKSQQVSLSEFRWNPIDAEGEVTARHENAFIEYKDKFYLIGGRGIHPVNVFDPETNSWETKGKSPMEIHHFQPLAFASEANETVEPSLTNPAAINLLAGGTLEAWKVPSPRWSLAEGTIIGHTGNEKLLSPEWLYTKQRFGDFVFTCELRLSGDDNRNTGIYYRVNVIPYPKSPKQGRTFEAPSGYEFDAAYHKPGKVNFQGTLGDWYARPKLRIFPDPAIIKQAYKEEEWNRMTIRARGNRLEYWINAIKVMDFVDSDPQGSREGVIGFQMHNGSVMKVEYRNIHVLPLKP
ncbi:MAG: DUF1080 domain-containing protein [Bacteroidales bacterium]